MYFLIGKKQIEVIIFLLIFPFKCSTYNVWKLPLALFVCAAWLKLASCQMIFALFLQLAQIFDTSGENPHNSEQTELRLQQRWKVQFVTAMSQPVQLVLCVLLLNLRFRHLWLIYSRITTSHYGARCDILKTKSDSDGARKKFSL